MFRVLSTRLVPQRSSIVLNRNLASGQTSKSKTPQQPKSPGVLETPGFTSNVVKVPNQPVGFAGSTKDTDYKNPEYFCYHKDSFGESMEELAKYRLPAPSSKAKK